MTSGGDASSAALVQGSFKGIRVTKRGASPRIMAAEVVGSRGTTPVDGATLRAKLGLFDTWAYFTSISGEKAPADADAASGGATVAAALVRVRPPRAPVGRAARDRDRRRRRAASSRCAAAALGRRRRT